MSVSEQYIVVTFQIKKEDDMYSALCLETGTASCGDTLEEAISNIRDAVTLHLDTLEDLGERTRFFKEKKIRVHSKQTKSPSKLVVEAGEAVVRDNIRVCAC